MRFNLRNLFPYFVIAAILASVLYAVTLDHIERADFAFNNGTEIKTLDPSKAEGQPEGRVLDAAFEGLLSMMPVDQPPDEDGIVPLYAAPGVAESFEISEDGKVYTFKIRKDAKWSNGREMTADDFVFSWQRCSHPDTASKYAFQLHYIVGCKKYNYMEVEVGDHVEVELYDRPGVHSKPRGNNPPDKFNQFQPFPRGTIHRGIITKIIKPKGPEIPEGTDEEKEKKIKSKWKDKWVFLVDLKPTKAGKVLWEAKGKEKAFSRNFVSDEISYNGEVSKCHYVLIDWKSESGVKALDKKTLQITLNNPTAYFDELVAFYTYYPVNRECIEEWGSPEWTKAKHIVSNGPFTVKERRLRDRIRLKKNPLYWDADSVQLNTVDALTVSSETTDLNMLMNGQIDWGTTVPATIIPALRERNESLVQKGKRPFFITAPATIVYFYRINVERPPFNDTEIVTWDDEGVEKKTSRGILVRHALNLALDKEKLCKHITLGGERPATFFVPPGLGGYKSPKGEPFNAKKAKKLLALAGFPGGQGMPKFEVIFNQSEAHRAIAEVIQQDWKSNLGIDVELQNLEWSVYNDRTQVLDYDISRAGWVPDYSDANTFLDMWVTNGDQNNTGWGNKEFDRLIEQAAKEPDRQKRFDMLHKAEAIFLKELPVIPIYHYVTKNTLSQRVRGFYPNNQDKHNLKKIRMVDE